MVFLSSFVPTGFDSSDSDDLNRELVRDHRAPFADATWQRLPGNMSKCRLIPTLQCLFKVARSIKQNISFLEFLLQRCPKPAKLTKHHQNIVSRHTSACFWGWQPSKPRLPAQLVLVVVKQNRWGPGSATPNLPAKAFWNRCRLKCFRNLRPTQLTSGKPPLSLGAPLCQRLRPSQKCHLPGPTECEVAGACITIHGQLQPDLFNTSQTPRLQTFGEAALLRGGKAHRPENWMSQTITRRKHINHDK